MLRFAILLIFFSFSVQAKQHKISVLASAQKPFGTCLLPGKLIIPKSPKALVIIIHGSGPQNMNGRMPTGHNVYKDIAKGLKNFNIASIRYSKRSAVKSCAASLNDPSFTHHIFVEDVLSIMRFAHNRSDIKNLPVFLIGHSQGVNFATLISKDHKEVKGQVLLAGLGKYTIDKTLIRQLEDQLMTPGLAPTQKKQLKKMIENGRSYFSRISKGVAKKNESFMGAYSSFWNEQISLTAKAASLAAQVKVPSLVIYGQLDKNVTLQDYEALKIATSKIKGSKSILFPRLNHFLSTEQSTKVSTKLITSIGKWISILVL